MVDIFCESPNIKASTPEIKYFHIKLSESRRDMTNRNKPAEDQMRVNTTIVKSKQSSEFMENLFFVDGATRKAVDKAAVGHLYLHENQRKQRIDGSDYRDQSLHRDR